MIGHIDDQTYASPGSPGRNRRGCGNHQVAGARRSDVGKRSRSVSDRRDRGFPLPRSAQGNGACQVVVPESPDHRSTPGKGPGTREMSNVTWSTLPISVENGSPA